MRLARVIPGQNTTTWDLRDFPLLVALDSASLSPTSGNGPDHKIGQETPPGITHPEYFTDFSERVLRGKSCFWCCRKTRSISRDDPAFGS
jgi:hypothetical protein